MSESAKERKARILEAYGLSECPNCDDGHLQYLINRDAFNCPVCGKDGTPAEWFWKKGPGSKPHRTISEKQ